MIINSGQCCTSYRNQSFDLHCQRGSHRRCCIRKNVIKNFAKFIWKPKIHRKTPVLESLFNKVVGLQAFSPAVLLKRDSDTGFPVNIPKFSRTPILENVCKRLLLVICNVSHSWKNVHIFGTFNRYCASILRVLNPLSASDVLI